MPRPKKSHPCRHTYLLLDAPGPNPSNANIQPFRPPSPDTILAATQRTSHIPSSTTTTKPTKNPLTKSTTKPQSLSHLTNNPPQPPPHPLLPPIKAGTFPAVLVLPGDVLDVDMNETVEENDLEEPQDVASWRAEPERNRLGPPPSDTAGGGGGVGRGGGGGAKAARERGRRRVLYVIAPPEGVGAVPGWVKEGRRTGVGAGNGKGQQGSARAKGKGNGKGKRNTRRGSAAGEEGEGAEDDPASPSAEDVARYLAAFYWPLEVRVWDGTATFVPWKQQGANGSSDVDIDMEIDGQHDADAAATASIALRFTGHHPTYPIRHRPPPDGAFPGQLNLNDLLDGVIGMLPADAYAACLLVHQDLYEGDDDDFCCGRAYGGSRIACVSMARYRPGLYVETPGEERHWWPGAHCADFVRGSWEGREPWETISAVEGEGTAMRAAVDAVEGVKQDRDALWLGRVCKTTVHELGHCFGVAHCMYAACLMQATAGLEEDERQPPYLCPVDLMKLAWAMDEAGVVDMGIGAGTTKGRGTKTVQDRNGQECMEARMDVRTWLRKRYAALREVCGMRIGVDRLSTAFDAWLVSRLAEMDAVETGAEGCACPEEPPSERMGKKSAGTRRQLGRTRDVVVLSSDSD